MIIYSDAKLITSSLPHTEKSLGQLLAQNLRTQAQIPLKFQMKLSIASRKTEGTQNSNYGVTGDSSHGASTYYVLGHISRLSKRHKLIFFTMPHLSLGTKTREPHQGFETPIHADVISLLRLKITRITF